MTTEPSEAVTVRREGTVAWLTLNRPGSANAVGHEMALAFRRAAESLTSDPPAAVVLAAEGKVFCAGGDVFEMSHAEDLGAYLQQAARDLHAGLLALTGFEPVIVAVVDGAAAGAGLGLALTADIVIATERARFLTAYELVGLTPDGGTSYWLPRAVGAARATAMSAAGLVLDVETARSWGLVTRVAASTDLAEVVGDVVRRLAEPGFAPALARTRRLYGGFDHEGYGRHLAMEAEELVAGASSPATIARIADFVEGERARKDSPKSRLESRSGV